MAIIQANTEALNRRTAHSVMVRMNGLLTARYQHRITRKQFLDRWGRCRTALRLTIEYELFRQAVLKRSSGKCEDCQKLAVHVHHVVPVAMNVARCLDPTNGRAQCEKCHKAKHDKRPRDTQRDCTAA